MLLASAIGSHLLFFKGKGNGAVTVVSLTVLINDV